MIADVLRSRVDTAVDASSSHVHVIVTPRRYDGAAVTLSRDLLQSKYSSVLPSKCQEYTHR